MKKRHYKFNVKDFKTLMEMGYDVHCFEWWHYRVKKYDDAHIDIFPTTRTWCFYENREYVGKGEYTDIFDLVESKLDSFMSKISK